MATPTEHAVVSVSAYNRWSHCTAAPRFEEQFPAESNVYTEEGRLAHSVCELYARKYFTVMSTRKFNSELKKLKEDPMWQDEMVKCAEIYLATLKEAANGFTTAPIVAFEERVDLADYIPEGFGTCDCAMVGDDVLRVFDYKHGKGVFVSSVNNGQMRLYALGMLKKYYPLFGDTIKRVCTAIVQPRITEEITEEWISVDELLTWAETSVIPQAQMAFYGLGSFEPGEWCKFCRGRAQCRGRAEYYAGFSEYTATQIEGRLTESDWGARQLAAEYGADVPPVLDDDEVADLLIKAAGLVDWYEDLQEYARSAILAGHVIPGWKVVEGKRQRAFTDADAAMKRILDAGYDKSLLYDYKPKTLAQLEKLTGKTQFGELVGDLITLPPGKPTLAAESDKRPPYQPTAPGPGEFAGEQDGRSAE